MKNYIFKTHKDTTTKKKVVKLYSGITDKNDIEIYDGDVIKTPNGMIWEVKLGKYCWRQPHQPLERDNLIGWYLQYDDDNNYSCQTPLKSDVEYEIVKKGDDL